jgi:hypothetical protein
MSHQFLYRRREFITLIEVNGSAIAPYRLDY